MIRIHFVISCLLVTGSANTKSGAKSAERRISFVQNELRRGSDDYDSEGDLKGFQFLFSEKYWNNLDNYFFSRTAEDEIIEDDNTATPPAVKAVRHYKDTTSVENNNNNNNNNSSNNKNYKLKKKEESLDVYEARRTHVSEERLEIRKKKNAPSSADDYQHHSTASSTVVSKGKNLRDKKYDDVRVNKQPKKILSTNYYDKSLPEKSNDSAAELQKKREKIVTKKYFDEDFESANSDYNIISQPIIFTPVRSTSPLKNEHPDEFKEDPYTKADRFYRMAAECQKKQNQDFVALIGRYKQLRTSIKYGNRRANDERDLERMHGNLFNALNTSFFIETTSKPFSADRLFNLLEITFDAGEKAMSFYVCSENQSKVLSLKVVTTILNGNNLLEKCDTAARYFASFVTGYKSYVAEFKIDEEVVKFMKKKDVVLNRNCNLYKALRKMLSYASNMNKIINRNWKHDCHSHSSKTEQYLCITKFLDSKLKEDRDFIKDYLQAVKTGSIRKLPQIVPPITPTRDDMKNVWDKSIDRVMNIMRENPVGFDLKNTVVQALKYVHTTYISELYGQNVIGDRKKTDEYMSKFYERAALLVEWNIHGNRKKPDIVMKEK